MENNTYRLKKAFDNIVKELPNRSYGDGDFFIAMYIKMFDEFPHVIALHEDGFYLNQEAFEFENIEDEEDVEYSEEDINVYKFENLNIQKTIIKIHDYFKEKGAYIIRRSQYPLIIYDKLIIYWNDYQRDIYVLCDKAELPEEVEKCVVDARSDEDHRQINYVTSMSQGFSITPMKVNKPEIDLDVNYNDDLPHEQIVDFIKSNKSGLVLLHGVPGTGKTSYIRHLVYTLKGRTFMILDHSVFNYITDASFVSLLMNYKNAVIILEDCEDMLADRLNGNSQLSTLLNLSDGILGDSFNFKFICTFNANIAKLDKAILRKGRLKCKYEFKPLSAEKTANLCESLGKQVEPGETLTLAEIFNYDEDPGSVEERKIGFTK